MSTAGMRVLDTAAWHVLDIAAWCVLDIAACKYASQRARRLHLGRIRKGIRKRAYDAQAAYCCCRADISLDRSIYIQRITESR